MVLGFFGRMRCVGYVRGYVGLLSGLCWVRKYCAVGVCVVCRVACGVWRVWDVGVGCRV